jgi:hypothetical protein
VQGRVMVELSGAIGASQVLEVHAGGSATPGCSAATLGLSLAGQSCSWLACSAISCKRKQRSTASSDGAAHDVGDSDR